MDYLGKEGAGFSSELWEQIEQTVIGAAQNVLFGRRFVPIIGPLGVGVEFINVDGVDKQEVFEEDGFVKTTSRKILPIPQLYSDFWLNWRDLEAAKQQGLPVNLAKAAIAAQKLASIEDKMVFYGIKDLAIDGLLTVKGSVHIKRSDWSTGEGAFSDVALAISKLEDKNFLSNHTLLLSPDLFLQLQRLQVGTGMLEIDRIKSMVKKVIKVNTLKENTAVLVSADSAFMDLVIGQDFNIAYLEAVDMNHHLRIMQTALLRIKEPQAIVIIG